MSAAAESHRTALADRVCAEFGFRDARGRAQRAGCLEALRALEREGQIVLPAPRTSPGRPREHRLAQLQAVPTEVSALLQDRLLDESVQHTGNGQLTLVGTARLGNLDPFYRLGLIVPRQQTCFDRRPVRFNPLRSPISPREVWERIFLDAAAGWMDEFQGQCAVATTLL